MAQHFILGILQTETGSSQYLIPNVDGGLLYSPLAEEGAIFDPSILEEINSMSSIGEQIKSFLSEESAISVPSSSNRNITSLELTAGTWDISAIGILKGNLTGTSFSIAISATSQTMGTEGDSQVTTGSLPLTNANSSLVIPSYRMTVVENTTVYLVTRAVFLLGSATAFGRLSAVKMG